MRGVAAGTQSDYHNAVRSRFADSRAAVLSSLRNALSDLKTDSLTTAERIVASRAIERMVRDRMGRDPGNAEVYEWMERNEFGGNVAEARFVLGNQRFDQAVKEEMLKREIEITFAQ